MATKSPPTRRPRVKRSGPVLTIGMIVKNEERSLERCLKALQPLRDKVDCELIIADTGSTDRTREIAAQYADLLFDFEWIGDFSAARNAVVERAKGEWCLMVDADEYLDPNIGGAIAFFKDRRRWVHDAGMITVRNYRTLAMTPGDCNDFIAARIARISKGYRYKGRVHEYWDFGDKSQQAVSFADSLVFHHDGYSAEVWIKTGKRDRNKKLLLELMEEDPTRIMTYLQCAESWEAGPDRDEYIRKGIELVERKERTWERVGPPLMRHAVISARELNRDDFVARVEKANEWFPNSPYTRIDVAFVALLYFEQRGDFANAAKYGEIFIKEMTRYQAGKRDLNALAISNLTLALDTNVNIANILLSRAYTQTKSKRKAVECIEKVDFKKMAPNTRKFLEAVFAVHGRGWMDCTGLVEAIYRFLHDPEGPKDIISIRAFDDLAAEIFSGKFIKAEAARTDVERPAYTAYSGLTGECEWGRAARILMTEEQAFVQEFFDQVEDFMRLPITAFIHAMKLKVQFNSKKLPMDVLDDLTFRMVQEDVDLTTELADESDFETDPEWDRALTMALFRASEWKKPEDIQAMERLAELEERYLPLRYTPETLAEDGVRALPPIHRFGWYLVQARNLLKQGDGAGYLRMLREGLTNCNDAKDAALFALTEYKRQRKEEARQNASPELLELAEKVKQMMSQYAADDPMIEELKSSPVYLQVADFIEE